MQLSSTLTSKRDVLAVAAVAGVFVLLDSVHLRLVLCVVVLRTSQAYPKVHVHVSMSESVKAGRFQLNRPLIL